MKKLILPSLLGLLALLSLAPSTLEGPPGIPASSGGIGTSTIFTNVIFPKPVGSATVTSLGAGNVAATDDAGYMLTYVTSWGGETLPTSIGSMGWSPPGLNVQLSNIPTSSSPFVVARRLYRNLGAGLSFHLIAIIGDNTTTTYNDNATESSLTGPIAPYADTASTPFMMQGTNFVFITSGTSQNPVDGFYNPSLFIGHDAGYSNRSSSECVVIGSRAGFKGTNGGAQTLVGVRAMYGNRFPYNCTAVGQDAGQDYTNGINVTLMGVDCFHFGSGDGNCGFGEGAGYGVVGTNNVIIGNWNSIVSQYFGNSNIFIGAFARPASGIVSNSIGLGAGVTTTNSQFVVGTANSPITVTILGQGDVFVKSNLTSGTFTGNGSGLTNSTFYTIPFQSSVSASPLANTTNYWGGDSSMNANPNSIGIEIPRNGFIQRAWMRVTVAGTLGTSETVTCDISTLSGGTTNLLVNLNTPFNAATISVNNTATHPAVTAGDFIFLRVKSPGWVTAPTSVRVSVSILIGN